MATRLDWNTLSGKVTSYKKEEEVDSDSSAFQLLMLESILSLSSEEASDSLTDGGNDRGIDAVYVDNREGRNDIHLFQFKYVSSFRKSKNNFPSNEIDKVLSFISDLLNDSEELEKTCNSILWSKVQEISEALDRSGPSFIVHFVGNLNILTGSEKDRLNSALDRYRSFTTLHYSLESIVNMFLERKKPVINGSIKLVDKDYFERTDGNIKGLIATIEATEIIRLITCNEEMSEVCEDIFDDNVRIYLSRRNKINKKIIASALSEDNRFFWYLNNGITITCDSFDFQAGKRAPKVNIENLQIVNGGQTSRSLFEAFQDDNEAVENVLLLVRIYETKSRDVTSMIAESTNSQTPINTRDLRSNDEIQKKLEEGFESLGFFYERKGKQHHSQPKSIRVDALEAGQYYLAYYLGMPEIAKKDRGKVFTDLYDQVFHEDITPSDLLNALQIFREIESIKKDVQSSIRKELPFNERHLFLIDGAFHVLYSVSQLCEHHELNESDTVKALELIDSAVELISDIVEAEEKKDPAFTFNRFFKDPKTRNLIQRAIASGKY